MDIKRLQPGMTVFDVGRTKMGNTTMKTVSVWNVLIVAVDPDGHWVEARWNVVNPPRRYSARDVRRWRLSKPVLVGTISKRLATRAELKAMKNASKVEESE
jgi:hypothetical protein